MYKIRPSVDPEGYAFYRDFADAYSELILPEIRSAMTNVLYPDNVSVGNKLQLIAPEYIPKYPFVTLSVEYPPIELDEIEMVPRQNTKMYIHTTKFQHKVWQRRQYAFCTYLKSYLGEKIDTTVENSSLYIPISSMYLDTNTTN